MSWIADARVVQWSVPRSRRAALSLAALTAALVSTAAAQRESTLRFVERHIGEEREGAPLIVALHPWGSSGRSMARLIESAALDRPVRVVAPDGPIPYGEGRAWLSAAIADHDPRALAREAIEAADAVAALVRARRGDEPVVVVGISQGAVVAYTLAARHPELARVVVPVSGLLPERVSLASLRTRVVALHGERDPFVPFARTRAGVERLRGAGHEVELRSLPAHGHLVRGPLRAALFATLRAEVARL